MKKANFACAALSLALMASFALPVSAETGLNADSPMVPTELEPVEQLIDSLDPNLYGGVYTNGTTAHIVATADGYEAIMSAIENTGLDVVVDAPMMAMNSRSSSAGAAIYSMAELEAAQQVINDAFSDQGVLGVGLDVQNNGLGVYIRDLDSVSDGLKDQIREVANIERIDFCDAGFLGLDEDMAEKVRVEAEIASFSVDGELDALDDVGISPAYAGVRGGHRIYINNGRTDFGTLATSGVYRYGKSGEVKGFITCGHGFAPGMQLYNGSGQYLGRIAQKWENGTVDVAIIESSSRSNGYMTDGLQITQNRAPRQGDRVTVYSSNGRKNGTVAHTNIYGTWQNKDGSNKIYYSGLFSMSGFAPAEHDSGSAVVVNNGNGTGIIVGIFKASYGGTLGGNSAASCIRKIMNIDVQPAS